MTKQNSRDKREKKDDNNMPDSEDHGSAKFDTVDRGGVRSSNRIQTTHAGFIENNSERQSHFI